MTFRERIIQHLTNCLNETELYAVRCRIEDAAITKAERLDLMRLYDARAKEVRKLYVEWRRKNGYPDEE